MDLISITEKKKGGDRLKCPKCNKNMKKNEHDVYQCKNPQCDKKYFVVPGDIFEVR